MNLFQKSTRKQGGKQQKKRSLIRILYVYPILFFFIGLSIIFIYYSFLQIEKYNKEVELTRKEFPEKQRAELKLKVLLLKDYISWVRTHPAGYTIAHIKSKINLAEAILNKLPSNSELQPGLPKWLVDSFNNLNAGSVDKVLLIDKNQKILFPEQSQNQDKINDGVLATNSKYQFKDIIYADSAINKAFRNNSNQEAYVFTKDCSNLNLKIGVIFDLNKTKELLQDIILDSVEKIKYSNNEYVFINTFDGFALLSKGKRQIPPLDIKKSTETNWQDIFNKEIEFAKLQDGGFYTYFWRNKPDMDRTEKTSYFSGITEWQWIIGTGFFSNDILPVIKKMNTDLWNDITSKLIRFIIFLIILSVIAYVIMRFYAKKAKLNILQFLSFFKRASKGFQIIDSENLAFSEFHTLALAANNMIEERERMRLVLSEEKSRLRYMIDAIPDLIFFKDIDSRFQGCNTAFEKYINRKSEEIVGLSETDLFPTSKAEAYILTDKNIIETLKPERSTEWIEFPNGQECLFYTLKTPYFNSENKLLGIIGISRDITEMEETRQRLIMAKEKAEESDRLKTAFLANMSHEIRTPMNAIIGFSDLLAEDDLSLEDRIDFISKIKSSGISLMSLINDIIDIAKIEAGQLRITETSCDINYTLNELLGTFGELKKVSEKNDIVLKLVIPDNSTGLLVITDPMRLQQILTNLLSNALKFTESGSIEFGYSIKEGTLLFYVKDTGIGILPGKQKFLFQRFSQIDSSTTRKYGGTGLGLAISRNLVELLGGSIGVKSNPGKGSIFYFSIPYKPVENKVSKKVIVSPSPINWRGKTILIAEDILQNYVLMQALLKQSGVRLLHAPNGQNAIDIVKSQPDIDLILMDIQLPLKTGYEALKEIKEIRPDIPVMSYTAFALPHEREKSLNAGFVEFIPKPIKVEILFPLIDKYLSKQDQD